MRSMSDGSFSLIEEMVSPSALTMEQSNNMVGLSIVSNTKHEFDVQNISCSTWDDFDIDQWYASQSDYNVVVSSKGISHFKNTSSELEYWIALEPTSEYGE